MSGCFSVGRADARGLVVVVIVLCFDCCRRRTNNFSIDASRHDERLGNNGGVFIVLDTLLHCYGRGWNHNGDRQVDDSARGVGSSGCASGFCFRFGVAVGSV